MFLKFLKLAVCFAFDQTLSEAVFYRWSFLDIHGDEDDGYMLSLAWVVSKQQAGHCLVGMKGCRCAGGGASTCPHIHLCNFSKEDLSRFN